MCAIVDANFVSDLHVADSRAVVKWLSRNQVRVAVGGLLLNELRKTKFRDWLREAGLNALLYRVDSAKVETVATDLQGRCRSNDHHVVALAQVSGARLLCSRDQALQADFKNLISRGKVFPWREDRTLGSAQRRFMDANKDICR